MAVILNGKEVASKIKEQVKQEIKNTDAKPILAVIQIGDNRASSIYVRNKEKACEEVGILNMSIKLSDETTEAELIKLIDNLNNDKTVDGILVQLPLPKHINEKAILDKINPLKDVDGFHSTNSGKLFNGEDSLVPCTPAGIIEILKHYNIEIAGKHCVVIGRSNIVGKPISMLLLNENATVTICHSKTRDLKRITRQADILIVAIGKEEVIKADHISNGAIVIDVGINRDENGKVCGDVDFDDIVNKAGAITPVPGGIGPMTIAMLMKNTLKAYKLQN